MMSVARCYSELSPGQMSVLGVAHDMHNILFLRLLFLFRIWALSFPANRWSVTDFFDTNPAIT